MILHDARYNEKRRASCKSGMCAILYAFGNTERNTDKPSMSAFVCLQILINTHFLSCTRVYRNFSKGIPTINLSLGNAVNSCSLIFWCNDHTDLSIKISRKDTYLVQNYPLAFFGCHT